jgi:protein TonB
MTTAARTEQRQPLNRGIAFSLLFHGALIASLVYLVHPHVDFLSPPKAMPVVDLAPPAPPAPPHPRIAAPPKPVPQTEAPQSDQLQATASRAPAEAVAPPAEAAPSPPQVVGTVVPPSYFSALESLIQKSLRYPARSVANDEEGSCTVRVSFGRDGAIAGAQMVTPSGFAALDGECREVFRRIGRFPPVPADTSPDATDFAIELPISFTLQ